MVTLDAWINHGRWITQCDCGQYAEAQRGQCACGRRFTAIYPPGRREAERLLNQRPIENRNWIPTLATAALTDTLKVETIDDLRVENQEHNL